MIDLRSYQDDLVGKLRVALRSSAAVLAYAPTGAGKTVIAAAIISRLIAAGKRVIFCVHRIDLIIQTAKTFSHFGIPFSIISGNERTNPYFPCFIASILTLKNRLGKYPADFIFVDEAHLSAAAGWSAVAAHYKGTGAKLIGLSGSPERLDGKPLGDVWDQMVMGPSVRWLIENGHLSTYRAFCPEGLDLSSTHTRKGEYVSSEVEELMAGRAILSKAVKHWKRFALGKRTIAFSRSVVAAEALAAEFRENGVMAVALDGETPQDDRREAFLGFADRQIDVIVNCSLFCEGFDLAAQVDRDVTIECVLDHSPTHSLAKHIQKNGRGLRKKPSPAILLDLVGNIPRLGLPDEDREWSLEGRKKKARETSLVICPKCFAPFEPAPRCPACGHVMAKEARDTHGSRALGEVDGELKEIDPAVLRRQRREEQYRAETLDDLVRLATDRGYKSPQKWAAHVFTARLEKQGAREWG